MERIERISIEDKNYPRLLKKISDPPKILYYRSENINKIGLNLYRQMISEKKD